METMRRRIYLTVSLIGLPVEVINWLLKLTQGASDLGTFYFNPIFFVMSAWIVIWLSRGGPAATVERVALLVVALAVIFRIVVAPLAGVDQILQNLQDTYWLIVLVSIITFLVFDFRRALLTSVLIYLLGVVTPWGLLLWRSAALTGGNRLAQVQLLSGMVLIAMWSLAWYREHFALEQERSRLTEALAHTDALTGLPNRRALYPHLTEHLELAQHGTPSSLLLIDLDHFKLINDRHGHNVGDAVLVQTAQLLRASLRASDVAGRWGGEEFLMILPATPAQLGLAIAEELCQRFAAQPFLQGGAPLPVTVSIGVSESRPGDTLQACVARADQALYHAKHQGRNRACGVSMADQDAAQRPVLA